MIYYDTTKMGSARHRSGLMRLSHRIREELGAAVKDVVWNGSTRAFVDATGCQPVAFSSEDWLMSVEQFSEAERPGFRAFIDNPPCRLAAMFHDAIPVRWPHISWPQSVQRHPEYMKLLAGFHQTWAISDATRRDFVELWRWQGVTPKSTPAVIELGSDFDRSERVRREPVIPSGRPSLLCVGIVEPRKNQSFLLDVAEALWAEGLDFDLHVVGRVNPHHGEPMAARMKTLRRQQPRFQFHEAAGDSELARLYNQARAVMFPTFAEGCGLPLLEALWRGVPCVCSDLPVLRENAETGGCVLAAINDVTQWKAALRRVLTDETACRELQREAMARSLPRWADTARTIKVGLGIV